MSAELYDGWYISANQYDVGPSSGTATTYQKHNVDLIYNAMSALGWTKNAVAGMVGNIMYESCICPACSYPSIGSTIATIGNTYAEQHPDNAYGLLQWKGRGSVDPNNNQLVGYAMRYGYQWYSGVIQMNRLTWEFQEPAKFHPQTVDGVYYTFASYATSTASAETLAKVWMVCYEGTYSVLDTRKANATYWYNYLNDQPGPEPPTPTGWITGADFADLATAYDPAITGVDIPYTSKDCFGYVSMVWHDIPAVASTDRLVSPQSPSSGTNSLWRQNMTNYPVWTFNTTSPDNQNPTPVLWYKESISNYLTDNTDLPTGCLLFHKIGEDDSPVIPSYYRGDGIGNYAHVGIYIGNCQVMQSGGRDASSVPGRGVHRTTYSSLTSSTFQAAWNYMAYVVWVDTSGSEPGPGPGPEPEPGEDILNYLLLWYNNNKKKGVKKRVVRY